MRGVAEVDRHAGGLEIDEARAVGRRADEHLGVEPEGDPVGVDEQSAQAARPRPLRPGSPCSRRSRRRSCASRRRLRPPWAKSARKSISGQVISKSSRIEACEAFIAAPQAAKSSGLQRPLGLEHARVLGDDVAAAAIDEVGQERGASARDRRGVTSRSAAIGPSAGFRSRTPSSQAARRSLYSPPACWWRNVGIGDDEAEVRRDRDRPRRQRAAVDQQRVRRRRRRPAMYWSMMPQRMPTKSFSARWQILAAATGSKGRPDAARSAWADADFERRRGAEARAERHVARDDEVGAGEPPAALFEHRRDAEHIVRPVVAAARRGRDRGRTRAFRP